MRHHLLLGTCALLLAGCGGGSPAPAATTPAAAATAGPPVMPMQVGNWRLSRRMPPTPPSVDTNYRFTDGTQALSVFVYAIPPDVVRGTDAQVWVDAEAAKLPQVFQAGVQRGYYRDIQLESSKPEPLRAGAALLPGHVTAAQSHNAQGQLNSEVQYLYVVRGMFLKVRATIPGDNWEASDVPNFAKALAIALYRS